VSISIHSRIKDLVTSSAIVFGIGMAAIDVLLHIFDPSQQSSEASLMPEWIAFLERTGKCGRLINYTGFQ
jgi:hypothetical protein